MYTLNLNVLSERFKKTSPRVQAYIFYVAGVVASVVAAAVLVSAQA